ncbi:2TM domain-containing protein [Sediminicola luteus]|uniref:2TM domain-containing protein n=1 Tax=Sediminicola luteus TaxID=319238 RepID=A0ABV2TRH1_9FLAO
MENKDLIKKERALQRIKELKEFYIHLTVYIAINSFISVNKVIRNMNNGETFEEAFLDFGTFAIWIFWGIGLAFHAMKVFSFNPFFGKDWEERQIKKYMEKEENESKKYL